MAITSCPILSVPHFRGIFDMFTSSEPSTGTKHQSVTRVHVTPTEQNAEHREIQRGSLLALPMHVGFSLLPSMLQRHRSSKENCAPFSYFSHVFQDLALSNISFSRRDSEQKFQYILTFSTQSEGLACGPILRLSGCLFGNQLELVEEQV